jgi:hypothetical protein
LSHSIVFTVALYTMAAAPLSVRLLLLAAGCIGLPVVMYHLIEHPLIRVGSALADRL